MGRDGDGVGEVENVEKGPPRLAEGEGDGDGKELRRVKNLKCQREEAFRTWEWNSMEARKQTPFNQDVENGLHFANDLTKGCKVKGEISASRSTK